MTPVLPSHHVKAGFSLIWMSIVVTVAALIFVSVLPGKEAGDVNLKGISTVKKLEYVENAMRSFMAFHGRRPCPADGQYAVNTKYFGTEAAIAGTCTGGTPAAPLGPDVVTGNIVGGTIPTKALGIPDEYAFDDWGRRFTYVVDMRATTLAACVKQMDAPTNDGVGGILIKNATSGSTLDTVMYAYISHGPSGYGAWPAQGSVSTLTSAQSAAMRLNSGSNDADMQTNAGVDSSFNYSTSNFTNVFVKKDRAAPISGVDTGFDDILWYRPDLKNTCCLGAICTPLGFRIDGVPWNSPSSFNGSNPDSAYQQPVIVGIGDINGDGIPDLVVQYENWGWGGINFVYVIFGTANTESPVWPILPDGIAPYTLNGIAPIAPWNTDQLNGTNGFVIWDSTPGAGGIDCCSWAPHLYAVTVADLNGDGYADIIVNNSAWGDIGNDFVIFGGPGAWPAGVDLHNLNGWTGVNGTNGFKITDDGADVTSYNGLGGGAWGMSQFEVGKIDDSGYNSLIHVGSDPLLPLQCCGYFGNYYEGGYVLLGKPDTGAGPSGDPTDNWHSIPAVIHLSDLKGTNTPPYGFHFYTSGQQWGSTTGAITAQNGTIGDMDDDGYADIWVNDFYGNLNLIYGRTRAQWQSGLATIGGVAVLDVSADFAATPNRATAFYGNLWQCCASLPGVLLADVDGDGVLDLLIGGSPNNYGGIVMYGQSTSGNRWPSGFNLGNPTAQQGFTMDIYSAHPSWMTGNFGSLMAADVNGDGRSDLILGLSGNDSPLGRTGAGGFLVFLQPAGGWKNNTNQVTYSNFHWDGTDSFEIYGPWAGAGCGGDDHHWNAVANVRPETGTQKPEIILYCPGTIYGLYENNGWPSSIDLANWY